MTEEELKNSLPITNPYADLPALDYIPQRKSKHQRSPIAKAKAVKKRRNKNKNKKR